MAADDAYVPGDWPRSGPRSAAYEDCGPCQQGGDDPGSAPREAQLNSGNPLEGSGRRAPRRDVYATHGGRASLQAHAWARAQNAATRRELALAAAEQIKTKMEGRIFKADDIVTLNANDLYWLVMEVLSHGRA